MNNTKYSRFSFFITIIHCNILLQHYIYVSRDIVITNNENRKVSLYPFERHVYLTSQITQTNVTINHRRYREMINFEMARDRSEDVR